MPFPPVSTRAALRHRDAEGPYLQHAACLVGYERRPSTPARTDSPAARYTPESDDIPWCRVPEDKVSLEDVDFLLSLHFEGAVRPVVRHDRHGGIAPPLPSDRREPHRPYGGGFRSVRMCRRPIAVMWVSFGSGPFTAAAPFYANVNDTPAYLRDTTPGSPPPATCIGRTA